MPTFEDAEGRDWRVEFDGLILDDVLTETGIDLADISSGGLAKINEHVSSLVRVLCVLCRDQFTEKKLTAKEFAKAIRGDAITGAVTAVLGAAAAFFPKSVWSEMESRLADQKKLTEAWTRLQPLLRKLNEPDVPEAVQTAVVSALAEMMNSSDLQSLLAASSADGPADTLSTSVSDSPESAASAPAA